MATRGGLQVAGVEFVTKNLGGFTKSLGTANTFLQRFGKALGEAEKGGSSAFAVFGKTIGSMTGLSKSFASAKTAAQSVGSSFAALSGSGKAVIATIGALSAATIGVVAALGAIVVAIGGAVIAGGALAVTLGKLAVEASALEGISQAFANNAAKFGVSLNEMRSAAAGTISDFDLMKTANLALAGAGRETGRELGRNLPELLKIARASARATGNDVNWLFNSLVTGIKRGSPLLIDNTGLVLKLGAANQKLADDLGITTAQLTAEQKQIAILNATVEAGASLTEGFDNTQLTAAENMMRMNASMQNIKDTIGLALQPALKSVTNMIATFGEKIADSIREGGTLRSVLIGLGAVASLVADVFVSFGNKIMGFISAISTGLSQRSTMLIDNMGDTAEAATARFFSQFGDGMADTVTSAIRWGAEIVAGLAEGMINAAATVLTTVMNSLTRLFSFWLAPGSPPRVAPNIDKWGASAMSEYLQGFSEADFSVLDSIQGTLKRVLSGPEFANISERLISTIGTGGAIDAGIFDEISSKAGKYGNEIAELARRQFNLAGATEAATEAQLAFDNATKQLTGAQTEVDKLTREYNKLLRAGASEDVLKANLPVVAEIALSHLHNYKMVVPTSP